MGLKLILKRDGKPAMRVAPKDDTLERVARIRFGWSPEIADPEADVKLAEAQLAFTKADVNDRNRPKLRDELNKAIEHRKTNPTIANPVTAEDAVVAGVKSMLLELVYDAEAVEKAAEEAKSKAAEEESAKQEKRAEKALNIEEGE